MTTRASRVIAEWLDGGTPEDPRTQELLATRLSARVGREVSQSTVSLIARGKQLPRADLVGAFRALLQVEPEWWMPDADETGPHLVVGEEAHEPPVARDSKPAA
jgi:transcriptional regulator with XRE-family HTH domain